MNSTVSTYIIVNLAILFLKFRSTWHLKIDSKMGHFHLQFKGTVSDSLGLRKKLKTLQAGGG